MDSKKNYLLEEKGELKNFTDPFPEYPTAEEIHTVSRRDENIVENGEK